jgi:hypothetical protein
MVATANGSPVLARFPVLLVTWPEMAPVGASPARLFRNAKCSSAYFTFLLCAHSIVVKNDWWFGDALVSLIDSHTGKSSPSHFPSEWPP